MVLDGYVINMPGIGRRRWLSASMNLHLRWQNSCLSFCWLQSALIMNHLKSFVLGQWWNFAWSYHSVSCLERFYDNSCASLPFSPNFNSSCRRGWCGQPWLYNGLNRCFGGNRVISQIKVCLAWTGFSFRNLLSIVMTLAGVWQSYPLYVHGKHDLIVSMVIDANIKTNIYKIDLYTPSKHNKPRAR